MILNESLGFVLATALWLGTVANGDIAHCVSDGPTVIYPVPSKYFSVPYETQKPKNRFSCLSETLVMVQDMYHDSNAILLVRVDDNLTEELLKVE